MRVEGYGIDSLSSFFMDYGYKIGDGLDFPTKKLRVLTFSPRIFTSPTTVTVLTTGLCHNLS
ncbi:unnamed protein product [Thlaspi arvense]|uniref:Uncharacterized protein n=1 Tax=Thlaspi arvense TaxID=13288 RepID=A0AAU9R4Q6_THLAR|nr:unnamed protein product [Thlaspi arvense]